MKRGRLPAVALALGVVALGCGSSSPTVSKAPLGPPRVERGQIEVAALLGDAPKRAVAQGAGPHVVVASSVVGEGERLGAFVEATDDACLLAYARGSASIEDLDIYALSDDGSPIALDESPEPRPSILVCPPRPRRFYVALEAATGAGLAVLVAHQVPRAKAKAVALAFGARGALGVSARAEAFPGLADAIAERRRVLGGTWEESKRGSVAVDTSAPSFVAVSAAAGDCLDVLVVPNDDVGLVDVELYDDEGRQVAKARGAAESRAIAFCTEETFAGTLRLRSHVGQGACGFVVSRTSASFAKEARLRPEVAMHGVPQPLPDAEKARSEALAKAGYPAPSSTARGALSAAKIVSRTEDLRAPCSRIDLVAGAPLRRSALTVWSPQGALLGEAEGLLGGAAYACVRGRVRVDLEARGGAGPFAFTVRPVPWTGPELASAPLAASRMLSRASRGPHELFEGSPVGLRALALSATSLAGFTEDVAPGACLAAYLGIEGSGTGVTLRATDDKTGDEIDRAHGEVSAGITVCATTKPVRAKIEARTSLGSAAGIIGLRKLP